MIPLRLRLQNFMCYQEEQTLDFSGIHLACLAGNNGHGKSALLDAITWAIWGKSRAQRDDELISLERNATEMWVDFEFGLGAQRYRIWRQRSKRNRGQTDLHFYLWNAGKDEWQLLDQGGIRERQNRIITTLRLDYDTFVNSAFLLQGKADSFTVKKPAERKQILADILGLGRYDLYEAQARDDAQRGKEVVAGIERELESIDKELAQRSQYETELAISRERAAAAQKVLQNRELEEARLRLSVQDRRSKAKQLEDLRSRLTRAERTLSATESQLTGARKRVAAHERVLGDRERIEIGWNTLQEARHSEEEWSRRLLAHTRLQERMNRQRVAIAQERARAESEVKQLAEREKELEHRASGREALSGLLAEQQRALEELAEKAKRREAISAELRVILEEGAALRNENERVKNEGTTIREKLELLQREEGAACPLCGQSLDAEHRTQILQGFDADREQLADAWRVGKIALRQLDGRRVTLEQEDADLARDLRRSDAAQRERARVEAAIAEADAAATEVAKVAAGRRAREHALASGAVAVDALAALAQLESEMTELGYDDKKHALTRERIRVHATFDEQYQRQLLPALDGIAQARAQVVELESEVERIGGELHDDIERRSEIEGEIADLPQLETGLAAAEASVREAGAAERSARLAEGAAMQKLDSLDALVRKRADRVSEHDAASFALGVSQQLRDAFGKRGIQAMIIESAIPEVEVEANRLLSRMSEGRMNLRLETQREKVAGGTIETLEIIIADELGERSYDLYSGGEAFRANLALRIAISKLLSRRAGAQLQTLVIDEGFGTQDARGRQLLVEAINSIQHDFERVLVITHIEELRDLFPARIEVVKDASGSHISVE